MAQKSSLTKEQAVALAQRAQRRNKKERESSRNIEVAIVRKVSLAAGASALAALQRMEVPNQIGPVPWKVPAWLLLLGLEAFIDNRYASAFFGGLGDATFSVYGYRAISNPASNAFLVAGEPEHTLVAGDELP
ncbi:MAG TPA: hypothetical protein VFN67_36350 [Polyangiales bacterium]|nr:hypothetical protein [Polyangiales bacterium]